jgi:beta-glucosidase
MHFIRNKALLGLILMCGNAASMVAEVLSWDWSTIDTQNIQLPETFLLGVATSSYQVEGGNTNVWDRWAQQGRCPQAAGNACDHWNRYKEDAQLIQNVGANAYRMSVEWSRIEPQEGVFDEAALDHYRAECDELLARGIAPVITLHHYNDPIWFADRGGFEQEENIYYYVRFAKKVIDRLHDKVHLWLTFNSPASYAAKGYLAGMMPPGKKDMQAMAEVMKNVLEAHVQLYKTVKEDPVCAHAHVGTLHNIMQVDPAPAPVWKPWQKGWNSLCARMADYITHQCVYRFFTTGVFHFYIPFRAYVHHESPDAPRSLDFIGLNYYTHAKMHGTKSVSYENDIATASKDKTIYPEGLYQAIKELWANIAQPLNIPIYVTENGISPRNEEDRDLFLRRYLYALSQAMQEGVDVRGYFYWSLMDNYEWGTFGAKKYGLYYVDQQTLERTLKPSAAYFIATANRFVKPYA